MIPPYADRGQGLGTTTYGEWCQTVGLFQSLIFQNLPFERPYDILDVGCGMGRMYLAAKSYLSDGDHYTGLDVDEDLVIACRRYYTDGDCNFVYHRAANGFYAKDMNSLPTPWQLDRDYNLIIALSVWTHLNETDWIFYIREVARHLLPGSRAIVSFFILDDLYEASLSKRTAAISRYYPQPQNKWIFDTPAYDSQDWLSPSWVSVPEVAIAVRKHVFDREVETAGLSVVNYMPGSWKEQSGFFFQDVVIFERA
jgi:SAM-dependent methyltransferase